jgi:hypothetical protein
MNVPGWEGAVMATNEPLLLLCEQAVTLNARAFYLGQYEVAYHFLVGAMHVAANLGDEGRLRELAHLAVEQGKRITAAAPGGRRSAHERELFRLATARAELLVQQVEIGRSMESGVRFGKAGESAQAVAKRSAAPR